MSISPVASGGFDWRKSSKCESGACVGVARLGEFVLVGNTGDPEAPVSRFTSQVWTAFIGRVKHGNLDHLA